MEMLSMTTSADRLLPFLDALTICSTLPDTVIACIGGIVQYYFRKYWTLGVN